MKLYGIAALYAEKTKVICSIPFFSDSSPENEFQNPQIFRVRFSPERSTLVFLVKVS
jgi:hypothetical protein